MNLNKLTINRITKRNYTDLIYLAVFSGFSSLAIQIILIRELLVIFKGNELSAGIILANWLLINGIGAYAAKYLLKYNKSIKSSIILFLIMSILPPIIISALYFFYFKIFTFGIMVSISDMFFTTLIALFPFCFINGVLFTFISQLISSNRKKNRIAPTYAFESAGSILGGVLVNVLIILLFPASSILILLLIMNLLAASLLLFKYFNKTTSLIIGLTGLLIIALVIITFSDHNHTKWMYPRQEVIKKITSPYHQIVTTKKEGQELIYLNGEILETNNIKLQEERVHFPLSQIDTAQNVLIISDNIFTCFKELVKYPGIEKIIFLNIDQNLIDLNLKHYTGWKDTNKVNVKFVHQDPVFYIRNQSQKKFDLILVDLPSPSTAQINKYYTVEFFRLCRKHMTKNAVFSISLEGSENYLSNESSDLISSVYSSLLNSFPNVMLITGTQFFFLSADKKLNYSLIESVNKLEVNNEYVNHNYIDTSLIKLRSQMIMENLNSQHKINSIAKPISYFLQIRYSLSKQQYKISGIIITFVIILLFLSRGGNAVNFGLMTGGFSIAGLEYFLIFSYQVVFGSIFHMIGLIITFIMGGSAIGVFLIPKIIKKSSALIYLGIMTFISILSALIIHFLGGYNILDEQWFTTKAFYLFTALILGTVLGFQFHVATNIQKESFGKLAAKTYSSDLSGAAIGSLLTSVIIIPLWGVQALSLIIIGLNILAVFIMLLNKKIRQTIF